MDLEDEIFEVWKELCPSEAYSQGLEEYAGKLFVPTPDYSRIKTTMNWLPGDNIQVLYHLEKEDDVRVAVKEQFQPCLSEMGITAGTFSVSHLNEFLKHEGFDPASSPLQFGRLRKFTGVGIKSIHEAPFEYARILPRMLFLSFILAIFKP